LGGAPSNRRTDESRSNGRRTRSSASCRRRFEFPDSNFKGEVWTRSSTTLAAPACGRPPSIVAIARLRPGVEYARAQAELDAVMRRLEAD
jgi:hypothetical protein